MKKDTIKRNLKKKYSKSKMAERLSSPNRPEEVVGDSSTVERGKPPLYENNFPPLAPTFVFNRQIHM